MRNKPIPVHNVDVIYLHLPTAHISTLLEVSPGGLRGATHGSISTLLESEPKEMILTFSYSFDP